MAECAVEKYQRGFARLFDCADVWLDDDALRIGPPIGRRRSGGDSGDGAPALSNSGFDDGLGGRYYFDTFIDKAKKGEIFKGNKILNKNSGKIGFDTFSFKVGRK